ncbi:sucrose transporter protein [Rutstroemia sp. NJR-2017a WRK4]|nr:sucrose transporter protein [Rutstroemia sp. NJR-2017a WRK4]
MTIRNIDDDAADFRFDVRAIKRGDATITVAEEYQIEDPEGFPRRPRIRIRSQLATEVPAAEERLENSRADNYDSQEEFESKANMASWSGQPAIKGSTEQMRMALLTFSLVGLQFVPISLRTDWTTWLMDCTPYLLSLGLTKSRTSLVWIAGPLSGLIMAPLVGAMADRSRSKWGRRRPYMVGASILVALCLLVLGWTKEIVSHFVEEGDFNKTCTIFLAVLAIYAVDFAINAASRMAALGHLIGYAIGTVDLVQIFGPSMGDTQFKKLILVAAFALLFCVGITSWAVTERVLISSKDADAQAGIFKIARQIYRTTMTVPPKIQAILWSQFWSWIGWFPFLFYGTTYVGETYFRYDAPHEIKQSKDALGDIGRIGSMSLVVFSLVSSCGSFILPLLIKSPDEDNFTQRPPASIARFVEAYNKHKPDLLGAWFVGHLMFSSAMFLAPFASSFRFATSLIAFCGLPWSVASWAPYAFLGVEVNKMGGVPSYRRLSTSEPLELESPTTINSPSLLRLEHGSSSEDVASTGELSGIYFGILNIYTTIPQFIGTFISMIVFSILEPGKSPELAQHAHPDEHHGTDGPNAIAVCLFIGAISTLGAAYATKKLRDLQ